MTKKETMDIVVETIKKSKYTFYRLLSINDVDKECSHQSGYYIPFGAYFMIFGKWYFDNIEKINATIYWGVESIKTESVFTYYPSKKEARLTRINNYEDTFNKENVGALFILIKNTDDSFSAFILKDNEMDCFYKNYNLIPGTTNRLLYLESNLFDLHENIYNNLNSKILKFAKKTPVLLSTEEMSANARELFDNYAGKLHIRDNHDLLLLRWLFVEENLFYAIEYLLYYKRIRKGFKSVEEFLGLAKTMTNSRKSRAGHSLENMLKTCFEENNISYKLHGNTEGKTRVDFLFPGEKEYKDTTFPDEKLVSLESKMSLKERWKEAVHEAKRIETKHLFTLEPVSESKIIEMGRNKVKLVTASENKNNFPPRYRDDILDLKSFIKMVKEKQGI